MVSAGQCRCQWHCTLWVHGFWASIWNSRFFQLISGAVVLNLAFHGFGLFLCDRTCGPNQKKPQKPMLWTAHLIRTLRIPSTIHRGTSKQITAVFRPPEALFGPTASLRLNLMQLSINGLVFLTLMVHPPVPGGQGFHQVIIWSVTVQYNPCLVEGRGGG